MIQKVSFRNYKAYRSLDLELEPFTVLVGPNASGKTTLLEGLRLISIFSGNVIELPGEIPVKWPGLQSFGTNGPIEMSVEGRWNGTSGSVRARSEFDPDLEQKNEDRRFKVSGEWGGKRFPGSSPSEPQSGTKKPPKGTVGVIEQDRGTPVRDQDIINFGATLMSTAVLRFEPRRLAQPSYSEEKVPRVRSDGSGLASVLAYLKLERDEDFDEVEFALKQIVPAVRRIRIERAAVEQTTTRTISLDEQRHEVPEKRTLWGNKLVLDMRGAKGVPADSAGEGTIMALGLLTVLMGPTKPRLVLLDDIELGLHPAAQGKLIEILRKVQARDPELQIVATSHSPFVLNYLEPKEVRMTFLAENGFARCEKLTAHPEFERWKDLMSPGEFWSTVGEDWLDKHGEATARE